uniref:DNA_LIGASE_A3 domain-containing protein n=1 Tax=Heterorhabditis bacteriophora TaxID=37862 RepID=A0A1I7WR37_HETBA
MEFGAAPIHKLVQLCEAERAHLPLIIQRDTWRAEILPLQGRGLAIALKMTVRYIDISRLPNFRKIRNREIKNSERGRSAPLLFLLYLNGPQRSSGGNRKTPGLIHLMRSGAYSRNHMNETVFGRKSLDRNKSQRNG